MTSKHETDATYGEHVQALGRKDGWQAAYNALSGAGPAAVPAILEGLKNDNWRVRRWCAAFLDHHADDRCVVALVDALRDESAEVRRHAVHGIGCQACKAEPL